MSRDVVWDFLTKHRKLVVGILIGFLVISCTDCKKMTICDYCLREARCVFYDDAYCCDECYESIKYWEEMDELYDKYHHY